MIEMYSMWMDIARSSLEQEVLDPIDASNCRSIVIVGMGGSGIIGDYLVSIATEYSFEKPIMVIKDLKIPPWIGKGDFIVAISYSGKTYETIRAVKEALNKGCKVSVVASGGDLIRLAEEKKLPRFIAKSGLVPRAAFPALFMGSLKILWSCGIDLVHGDVIENSVKYLSKDLCMDEAKDLAEYIHGYVPVIVADPRYYPLAIRAKNEFNENSKIPTKVEIVPEWAHNDIVGWERGLYKMFRPIVIDPGDQTMHRDIVLFAYNYFEKLGMNPRMVSLKGSTIVDKLMYGTLLFGLSSVLLANMMGVDPLSTKSISEYKEFTKSKFTT